MTRVEQVLTDKADQFPALPDRTREPRSARMASALVSVCQDTGSDPDGADTAGAPVLTVTVDAALVAHSRGEAGASAMAGPRIGPEFLDELLCTGRVEIDLLTDSGEILTVGPTTSVIPPRIRRAVLARDDGCTIAGCTSRYRLQVHHITQRSRGGTHHPANLTTLCWYHHHIVIHGHGHRIDPNSPPQRRRLHPPNHRRPPSPVPVTHSGIRRPAS